ncbi:adenine phosphoribosyltransferase [Aeromicrobium sp. Leaf350]|uniref:adenine phosphoribosyltransferase n=1 Tax=Aeromicrobium sp. Leaf350 TaxID=2876565 RepID=UPI001E3828AB|nr:adenine phosphoribosyltransferase [Aeromicrobium sp. Leaf350]
MTNHDLADLVDATVPAVPDWPEPGVLFRDISPLLADPQAFGTVAEAMAAASGDVDLVLGVEARGFLFGLAVAERLQRGFVPVRKAGKLPGRTESVSYDLEYGSATIEVPAGAVAAGQRVVVVDDVLATGGTLAATIELARRCGAEVVGAVVLIEIEALGGRAALDVPLTALRVY